LFCGYDAILSSGDGDGVTVQEKLIEMALRKGGDLGGLLGILAKEYGRSKYRDDILGQLAAEYPEYINNYFGKFPAELEAVKNKENFYYRGQNFIKFQLKLFWENLSTQEDAIKKVFAVKSMKGYCAGLSMFWLYAKWLQFVHPEKAYGYTSDWFNKVVKDLVSWDGKEVLNDEQVKNFQRFFSIVHYLQAGNKQFKEQMRNIMLDTDGKVLQDKFSIGCAHYWKYFSCGSGQSMTLEQFTNILKEKVSDDKMIYLVVPSPNTSDLHANGLFKHGEYYYYYDPNEDKGEYKDTSIENIAKIIFREYSESQSTLRIALVVYDFDGIDYIDDNF
jgi:hypothetical protein